MRQIKSCDAAVSCASAATLLLTVSTPNTEPLLPPPQGSAHWFRSQQPGVPSVYVALLQYESFVYSPSCLWLLHPTKSEICRVSPAGRGNNHSLPQSHVR